MKRLLLLFILSPVILLGQKQAQQVIDSNRDVAAINLQSMSSSMSNNRCTKVAAMHVTDNGEYTTTVVFLHSIPGPVNTEDTFRSIGYIEPGSPMIIGNVEPGGAKIIGEIEVDILKSIGNINIDTPEIIAGIDISTPKIIANIEIVLPKIMGNVEVDILKSIGNINVDTPEIIAGIDISTPKIIVNIEIVAPKIMGNLEVDILKSIGNIDIDTPEIIASIEISLPKIITNIEIVSPKIMGNIEVDILKNIGNIGADTSGSIAKTDAGTPNNNEARMPVENMHLSPDGYSLLQKLEGYSPALYTLHDGGYTIGFGFFVPFSESNKWRNGITWAEAEHLIQQKVPAYEAQVKEYINVPLTQNEFDALTMLAYNLGGFSRATSIINDVNEQADVAKLQSDWKKFVHSKAPNVSKGLMKRRNDEIEVRKSSDYQPGRKIQIFKSR